MRTSNFHFMRTLQIRFLFLVTNFVKALHPCTVGGCVCLLFLPMALLALTPGEGLTAKKKETYDIVYLRTSDFEKILDYKDELEGIFDTEVTRKLKIVGLPGGEYALLYDGNLSAKTVSRTLIKHAEMLSKTGFDEPYSTKGENFHILFNVSYGMGRDLDSLKKRYQLLYSCLGEEVKRDLFIEKTAYGNYLLVYRYRGDEASTSAIAKKHAAVLQSKRISTSLTRENSNSVVYGESSLIDDDSTERTAARFPPPSTLAPRLSKETPGGDQHVQAVAQKSGSSEDSHSAQGSIARSAASEQQITTSSSQSKVERRVAEYLNDLRAKGVIGKDEETGWMVYDLENDRSLVDINANVEFQAASMIKPFVALAFFHQVREGKLQYDTKSKKQMEAMIQRSSNPATNFIMRRAGGPEKCNTILKKYYGHIFKKTEIKEYIPADGRTYLNSALPADYVRFLRSLWNMDLPYSKEIRRVMALPGRDRLYYGTPIPRGTLVYNKTGSTARLCGDMGILVAKKQKGSVYPYVIVGIIERRTKASNYGQWMATRSKVIREVSTLVYEGLKQEHHLL